MALDTTSGFFADFGIAATVAGVAVRGIFDKDYQDALGLIAGNAPSLLCATADISAATLGAAVVVPAGSYTIAEIQPDGTGITRLFLEH